MLKPPNSFCYRLPSALSLANYISVIRLWWPSAITLKCTCGGHPQDPTGETRVKIHPKIRTNNGDTYRSAALAHQGIILQPTLMVGDGIQKGDLVALLPTCKLIELDMYAVYPSRKLVLPRVRALVDFLVKNFEHVA